MTLLIARTTPGLSVGTIIIIELEIQMIKDNRDSADGHLLLISSMALRSERLTSGITARFRQDSETGFLPMHPQLERPVTGNGMNIQQFDKCVLFKVTLSNGKTEFVRALNETEASKRVQERAQYGETVIYVECAK